MKREILVYAHWSGMPEAQLMGALHAERLRGKEIFSFDYDRNWLHGAHAQTLDPDLHLYSGLQFLPDDNKINFGMFTDSSPDRWGRVLMQRREAVLAKREQRQARTLTETDYLLGVYDLNRMGALRYCEEVGGAFMNNDSSMASPPWAMLRELEAASLQMEQADATDHPDYLKWLNMLLAPGSSLGGARPKAGVTDPEGNLWIAKFPSAADSDNTGAWEMVAYRMATGAGIRMSESRTLRLSTSYDTFLSKRFDRTAGGERLHFASAMTLLGLSDGHSFAEGASYLDLAEFIISNGAQPQADLEELWRRIVFSICISNTDDHLRNHGFMLSPRGWVLSPAYDLNPSETGRGLSLNINEHSNELDLGLAMEVHPYFRLSEKRAQEIILAVNQSVQHWRTIATECGIGRSAQELKAPAFGVVSR